MEITSYSKSSNLLH